MSHTTEVIYKVLLLLQRIHRRLTSEGTKIAKVLLRRAAASIKQYHASIKKTVPVALKLVQMKVGAIRFDLFKFMESIYGPIARSKNPAFKSSCEMLIQILCYAGNKFISRGERKNFWQILTYWI